MSMTVSTGTSTGLGGTTGTPSSSSSCPHVAAVLTLKLCLLKRETAVLTVCLLKRETAVVTVCHNVPLKRVDPLRIICSAWSTCSVTYTGLASRGRNFMIL